MDGRNQFHLVGQVSKKWIAFTHVIRILYHPIGSSCLQSAIGEEGLCVSRRSNVRPGPTGRWSDEYVKATEKPQRMFYRVTPQAKTWSL